jgi:hypothetical protein
VRAVDVRFVGPEPRMSNPANPDATRARGRLLGRPKGSLGPSKLDGKEGEISMLIGKRLSKASIAKILEVASSTLHSFIQSRRLEPQNRRQA